MTDLGDYLREELARLEARCCEIREMLSDIQWQAYNLAHKVTVTPEPPPKSRRFVQPSNTDLNHTASTILRTTVIDPDTRRATAASASAPRVYVEGQR